MNKRDVDNFLKGLDSENQVDSNKSELFELSKQVRAAKPEVKIDDNFKEQLKDDLYNKYIEKRKDKAMQPIEKVQGSKPFWKKWQLMAPAALVLVLAVAASVWYLSGTTEKDSVETKIVKANISFTQGNVEVKSANGDWAMADSDTVINEGSSVKAGKSSKAIIEFEDKSILRLDANSEVELTTLLEKESLITQVSGNSYNRVTKGTDYTVVSDDTEIKALGTAFGVENIDGKAEVPVLDSKVSIKVRKDDNIIASKNVNEGQEAVVDPAETGSDAIMITDIDKEKIKGEWYKWNVDQDLENDFKLITFEEAKEISLEITAPTDGTEVSEPSVEIKGTTDNDVKVYVNDIEVDNNEGVFSKSVSLSEGKNTIKVRVVNDNGDETTKELVVNYVKEEEKEDPKPAGDLTLSAAAKSNGVQLSWTGYTGDSFKYYKVVRSDSNSNLKYPEDGYIKAISDANSKSLFDGDVADGKLYYYRVCAVKASDEVVCGNVVQVKVSIEQSSVGIALSAQPTAGGVNFFFDVTSGDAPAKFKLVISESANPSYPGAQYSQLIGGDSRSYTWSGLPNKTLHARIGAYAEGGVYAYSNDVAFTPTDANEPPSAVGASAVAGATGITLSWSKNNDVDFKYYKVVRSQTNANPIYPADGYITYTSREVLSYVDTQVTSASTGTYYYTICSVDNANQVTRSNVIAVVNGAIQ